ncbi:hypothetical protein Golomagni_06610, partial [Golovinomyces magnicellulatus]
LILGASGRTGLLTLQRSLESSHTVTALVRNPSSIPADLASNSNLTIVKGTPQSSSDVLKALSTPKAPDAVFFAINARRTTENPFAPLSPDSPADLLPACMRILVDAIAQKNIKPKLIMQSSCGAGSSWQAMSWIMRQLFTRSTMMNAIEQHNAVDKIVRESGLTFVMPRPGRLTDTGAAEVVDLGDDGKGLKLMSGISRESVAHWMVSAAETNKYDGKSPVLVN